ncbi:diguanylate cyclase [Conexibacter sp. SYSU D00693]|uniref:bifunctional diguanylate cyclase/phosphohydrolase n=1 Tax=Conexibacter sp. SYSU D00693 TaxID=2812560 RepID=UPI00196ACF26|nr:diguanylate cyclase [Conexibacter sp. SYSU D00693]
MDAAPPPADPPLTPARRIVRGLAALDSTTEARLAGRVNVTMFLGGGLAGIGLVVLGDIRHQGVLLAVAAIAIGWALLAALVPGVRRSPRGLTTSSTLGLALIAAGYVGTEGDAVALLPLLWFVVVFSAVFYPWRRAAVFIAGAAAVDLSVAALEPAYDQQLSTAAIRAGTYVVVGALAILSRHVLLHLRDAQQRHGAEQAALRRVATAVAAGSPPKAIFTLVAAEVAGILHADACGVMRFRDEDHAEVVGAWNRPGVGFYAAGTVFRTSASATMGEVRRTGLPARADRAGDPEVPGMDPRSRAASAPVLVAERCWGALGITSVAPEGLPAGAEHRLAEFAALIATAIINADDRQRLLELAATDVLTGLPNRAALADRLESEAARAGRHRRALSLVLVDVDRFASVVDRVGSDAADEVLAQVARILQGKARAEDFVARHGGDVFAFLLPETTAEQAYGVAERIRRRLGAEQFDGGLRITATVGLADLASSPSVDLLVRDAQRALYWGKSHGRDIAWRYDPTVVGELDAAERQVGVEHEAAIAGLRALARAVDAKDSATREHAERVAAMATRLAAARGWPERRQALLREAAVVHDVGKIGIPDAILLKPSRLTDSEFEVVKTHAELGARIVGDVLSPEQVEWIRRHHERPDGRGYPAGLTGDEMEEGCGLLALADAWDAMTAPRSYSPPMPVDLALQEIRALRGQQFTAEAVEALEALAEAGELPLDQPAGYNPAR